MAKTFIAAAANPHAALNSFNTNQGIGDERASLAEDWETEPTPALNAQDDETTASLATTDWE